MHLLCFGYGYCAQRFVQLVRSVYCHNIQVTATTSKINNDPLVNIISFESLLQIPTDISHILISIPPVNGTDLVYQKLLTQLIKLKKLKWLGYLSATNVYGNQQGKLVDELSSTLATNQSAKWRLAAETNWLSSYHDFDLPITIFRLGAIYGPNRSIINRLLNNEIVQVIEAKGHLFSRIHLEDIANLLLASIIKTSYNEIFNLVDDFPTSNSELINHAYQLINKSPPKPIPLDQAKLSPRALEFYQDNKIVNNNKVKTFFNYSFKFPSYHSGLVAIYHGLTKLD